jgi:hypothetical protein
MMNLCRSCGEVFGSVAAFDAHRIGAYGPGDYRGPVIDWTYDQGRRCLTLEELEEGYTSPRGTKVVFARNSRGQWSLAGPLARARVVLASNP